MKCAWCPKAATTEITVQPARYQSKRGIKTLIAREIKAPACEQHAAAVTEDRTPPPAQDPREPARPGHHRRLPPVTPPDDQLIRRHDGLCHAIARRYYAPGLDRDDLLQEARIGLLSAFHSYDPARGLPFPRFAALAIRRRLDTAIRAALRGKHQVLNTAASLDAPLPAGDEDAGSLHDLVAAPAAPAALGDELHQLSARLDQALTPIEARAMQLVIFNGLDYQHAAREMHVTPKAIDNAVQRTRRKAAAIAAQLGLTEDLAA